MVEGMTHLPADIQNYMRKLAELDPPIFLTGMQKGKIIPDNLDL